MWIKSILLFLLINSIQCTEDEIAKVVQIGKTKKSQNESSNIYYIKTSNNGAFNKQTPNLTNHLMLETPCGGTFRNLQNLIESPKVISPRPISNLRCEYQIQSPYICENEYHVQFLEFSIDPSSNCENDKVTINYDEILCGEIMGIKKYRTKGGVLNITFASKEWELKSGKGFRLLVTRLPCVDSLNQKQTEIDSLEPGVKPDTKDGRCYHVTSSYNVSDFNQGEGHAVYGVPVNDRQFIGGGPDVPVIPLPPISPPVPPVYPPIGPILPPPFLPLCCRNIYSQPRFLLISQGFPSFVMQNVNDCIFVVQRSSPNVCRLKIIFKYFLLDDPQCVNSFVEIDGQRICGCKTNFVYETVWGLEPGKIIRMRTVPGSFRNAQGFVLDVIQEACPLKLQSSLRKKRHLLSEAFIHPLLNSNHPFLPNPEFRKIKSDVDDKFKSKFFNTSPNSYISDVCVLNHLTLFKLKLETIGIPKQYCLPIY